MKRILSIVLLCLALPSLLACGSSLPATRFTNPAFDFSFVSRVAVLPFENLSRDREAGVRATRLLITQLLASGAVDVVEPGEVRAALAKIPGGRAGRAPSPSTQEVIALGRDLGVEAVILGTVTQSEILRAGATSMPVVTLDAHMVETETGAAVWAATHTEKGSTLSAKILGTGGKPISETTRHCVMKLLETLLE